MRAACLDASEPAFINEKGELWQMKENVEGQLSLDEETCWRVLEENEGVSIREPARYLRRSLLRDTAGRCVDVRPEKRSDNVPDSPGVSRSQGCGAEAGRTASEKRTQNLSAVRGEVKTQSFKPRKRRPVRPRRRRGKCRQALSPGRNLFWYFFLELYCGSGHLGKAVSRLGITTLLWDIRFGAKYDLLHKGNQLLSCIGYALGNRWEYTKALCVRLGVVQGTFRLVLFP